MKRIFAMLAVSLFLTAVCAPAVTVSAQEPQKKEAAKTEKGCCREAQKCKGGDKKPCCESGKKDAGKKETAAKKKK
jgi:hypothetical protein